MAERETLESGIFSQLLGLNEEFFIDLKENWNEEEVSIKAAILQNLRKNFEKIDFEENPTTACVLESIAFESDTVSWLANVLGDNIEDPNILWEKIQHFIQVRLDALVVSLPEWSEQSLKFTVLTDDNQEKNFKSITVPSQKFLNGNEDSLRLKIKEPLADEELKTMTWYYATNCKEAQEILKNGFDHTTSLKNMNFSHGDGFYFTDSIKSAKQLFLHNSIKEFGTQFNVELKRYKVEHQNKIVVLAFKYDEDKSDLLKEYENHSIDLTSPESETRLRKIVHFFSQNPLPTKTPSIEKYGLAKDYKTDIEYIRGPLSTFFPIYKKDVENIFTKNNLIQLCVRCVGTERMLRHLEENIQEEVIVINVDEEEIAESSELLF
jgi:hypothetical protein